MFRSWWRDLFARKTRPPGSRCKARLALEPLEERALLTAGVLDPTFGIGGIQSTAFPSSGFAEARAVAIDPNNGDIYVAGTAQVGGILDFALARYLPNGTLDTSFGGAGTGYVTTDFAAACGPGDGLNPIGRDDSVATAVAIDPKIGDIVVGGRAFVTNGANPNVGHFDFAVAAYTPAGKLDPTFGQGGEFVTNFHAAFGTPGDAFLDALAIDGNGNIVAGGSAFGTGTHAYFALARVSAFGNPDTGFGTDGLLVDNISYNHQFGIQNDSISGLAIQPDGRIVAGGEADDGAEGDFAVARYSANGARDDGFGQGTGSVMTPIPSTRRAAAAALALGPDGRIVVAGAGINGGAPAFIALAEYDSSGTLIPTFGQGGTTTTEIGTNGVNGADAVAFDPAGNVVVAGATGAFPFAHRSFAVARYTPGGALDTSFDPDGPQPGVVTTSFFGQENFAEGLAIQPDGKIVVAGEVTRTNGDVSFGLARYTGDTDTVALNSDAYTVDEGRSAHLTILRDGDTTNPAAVTITTSDGSALAGTDYTSVSQVVTIPAGQSRITVLIPTADDGGGAPANKTFTVSLSDPSGAALNTLNPTAATVTIAEPELESEVQFGPGPFAVGENGGSISIPVTRLGDLSDAASVTVSVRGGSATQGKDFQIFSPTVQFLPGQGTASVQVSILNDGVQDGNETVNLTLTNPVNVQLGSPSAALLTINEAHPPPAHRLIFAEPVPVRIHRKTRVMVELFYADTGTLKTEFLSPFQPPAFQNIQVMPVQGNGAGRPDEVIVTAMARGSHKTVSQTFVV